MSGEKTYKMKNSCLKTILWLTEWGICIAVGFLIVNTICFFYERPVGWYDTINGVSTSVWHPGKLIVHGTEGYGRIMVDENGFLNPSGQLADEYILMLGTSHTQGKEVNSEKRYSVLVNNRIASDNRLYTYNIAADGHFLPSQIKHFKAVTEVFKGADMITIEIGSTDYAVADLEKAVEQVEYAPEDSANYFSDMNYAERTRTFIKESFPLISRIRKQMQTAKDIKEVNEVNTLSDIDMDQYSTVINKALKLMKSEYDKPLVFIYHPRINIEKNGTLSLVYSETWNTFKDACEKNGIDIIDCGADFIEVYNSSNKVPYGFSNTTLGDGHINEVGHQIIANEIITYWEDYQQ